MGSEGWTTMPFDQAVQVNPSVRLQRGLIYPFVDMQALDPGLRNIGLSEMREFKGGGSRFMNGDTLMARITPCLENGKIARFVASNNQLFGHGSTEFIVIRGKPAITDNGFAYYLTKWDVVHQYCISQMTGSSGRQRVPMNALSHLEVTIPPLKEQQAIACILGALDDKIELNRRMNQTLEAMVRAIFKSWFVDFDPVRAKAAGRQPPGLAPHIAELFPDSFVISELGEIPAGWRVLPIGEAMRTVGGSTPNTNKPEYWNDGNYHWATPKDLSGQASTFLIDTDRKITKNGLAQISSGLLPIGTVLLSSRAPVGYLAVVSQDKLPGISLIKLPELFPITTSN